MFCARFAFFASLCVFAVPAWAGSLDIASKDDATGEIMTGHSYFEDGAIEADLELANNKLQCGGQAAITVFTRDGIGSLGEVFLICNDGRSITGTYTYETPRSGWGVGEDDRGDRYRFLFGDLKQGALKEQFAASRTKHP